MKLWGNQVHAMTISFFLALLLAEMPSPPTDTATVRAVWLADLDPATVKSGTVGRWVFVPDSRTDDVTGVWQVEAAGAGDVLRVVREGRQDRVPPCPDKGWRWDDQGGRGHHE